MPGCGNKKFEDLFHAYELGMLSDADRKEFEMHLMVCEACFDDAQKLAEAAELVRHDDDIREVIEDVADIETDGAVTDTPQAKHPFNYRRLWQSLIPSLVVLGLLVVMILKPWQVEIHTSQDAVATQNRLAIMYFENLADPDDEQRLGDIITSLLITDLSESQYMNVISSQRLYDIARTMGKEGRSGLDKETALEIARRADAKWMLLGSIHQSEPYYSIAGQLVDVTTGDVIASQLTAGEPGENIFSLVDKLTVEIKNDLELPGEAGNELDPMVADVTTHSAEAYKNYLLGMESYRKLYIEDARQYLEKAVEEDSTFAMAYYYLSHTVSSMSTLSDKYMDLALKYLDKVNQKERYYILAKEAADNADYKMAINYLEKVLVRFPDEKEALFLIGNYHYSMQDLKKATEYFERVVELDPFSKLAFNMLAYCYFALGDYDKAVENADKYVDMAPNEANPYDTRGEILARMGRIDEAIESYKKAVQIRRDFASSGLALIDLSLYQRNYAEAKRYSREFAASGVSSAESKSSLYDACIYSFEGMTEEAFSTLDEFLDQDKEKEDYALLADKYYLKAAIYSEMGLTDKAIKNVRKARETMLTSNPENTLAFRQYEIQFLARGGRFEEAEKLLQEYHKEINGIGLRLARYHYCSGTIAYERGDYQRAIKEFEESLSVREEFSYMTTYMLAKTYMKLNKYGEAIPHLEKLFEDVSMWRLFYGIQDSRAHYYLGIAYEEVGKPDRAAMWYEKFLDIWRNADSSWTELDDARARLAGLRSRSELR